MSFQGWGVNGFFKFVVRGNVIGLAVGVVIGAAFSSMVAAFVKAFLTPLIGLATSSAGDYSNKVFTVGPKNHQTEFLYGSFINSVIAFVLTAAAIYFLVVLPVNKISEELNPHHDLTKAKRACPECLSQIPARARRCSYCTAHVDPIADEDSDKLIEPTPGEISLTGGTAIELKPAAEAKPAAAAAE